MGENLDVDGRLSVRTPMQWTDGRNAGFSSAPPDRLGKTEAWHILAADPGALLFLGIQPGTPPDAFRDTARRLDGSTASLVPPAIPPRSSRTAATTPNPTANATSAGGAASGSTT